MKKLLVLISLIIVVGCHPDEILSPIDLNGEVPKSLQIDALMGIKLESTIVSEDVSMNVKLPYTGTYRIKIRDIGNNLISQEKITANEGDNILKVYISALEKDGYTIELTDSNHTTLGKSTFVVQ